METRYLKAFLRIAETGSISRAAQSLGLSQPSLSQQLLRLEDEVGFALFERTARGVTLTEVGRVFAERARSILAGVDEALEQARHVREDPAGEVILAMPPTLIRVLGAPLVAELARTSPHVKLRLVEAYTGAILGWLETGRIDLGILYDLDHPRDIVTYRFASDEIGLFGLPDKNGIRLPSDGVSFAALDQMPLIMPGSPHGLRRLLEREGVKWGFSCRPVHEVDSLSAALDLAAEGVGYAVLPLCAKIKEADWRNLVMIRIGGGKLRRALCMARNRLHTTSHASVRVWHQVEKVTETLRDTGRWPVRLEVGERE